MIRRPAILLAAATLALAPMAGQSTPPDATQPGSPQLPVATEDSTPSPYLKDGRILSLTGGLHLPLLIVPDATDNSGTLKLGGAFSFTWQQFISPGLALGGSLAGSWNGTVADRTLFTAPLSFRTAYWWAALPFEFFGAAEIGAWIMRFDGKGMIGPFGKLGGGALWRLPSGWSLGLQAFSWFVPELHAGEYADLSRFGIFLETGLVAAFHL